MQTQLLVSFVLLILRKYLNEKFFWIALDLYDKCYPHFGKYNPLVIRPDLLADLLFNANRFNLLYFYKYICN